LRPHTGRTPFPSTTLFRSESEGRARARDPDGGGLPDRGAGRERDRAPEGADQAVAVLEGGLPPAPGRGARGAAARRDLPAAGLGDRKSTRLNSSHVKSSYA